MAYHVIPTLDPRWRNGTPPMDGSIISFDYGIDLPGQVRVGHKPRVLNVETPYNNPT
jgi:hypothetical protein